MTVVWVKEQAGTPPRLAFAVPTSVGSAPTRNRLRRVLREEARDLAATGKLGTGAWLVRLRPAAANVPHTELRATFRDSVSALCGDSRLETA